MPVKCITPGRAGFVVMTATFVMVFNVVFILPVHDNSCEDYYVNRVLQGPVPQDDPDLVKWVKSQMVPPSRHPYNLTYYMSGLHQEIDVYNGTSYSPSQEFILGKLEELFGDKILEPGTFLEAGAYDGEFLSNTLYLEHEFNWRGILVEANPDFFNQLLLKRRKSWALNVCLNTKPYPSQEKFLMASGTPEGTNHMANGPEGASPDPRLEQHISLGSSGLLQYKANDTQEAGVREVQCVPLYTVMRAVKRNHIDFLSLDVEHAEMGILDTLPWDKVSFSVLAIEHMTQHDLVDYMDQRGYAHVASSIVDHIFVNKKHTNTGRRHPT